MADVASVADARKGVAAAYKDWLRETYATQLSEIGRNATRDTLPAIGAGGAYAEVGIQSKPSAWIVEFSRESGAWTATLPISNYTRRLGSSFNSRSPFQGVLSRVMPVVRVPDEPSRAEQHPYWEWALVLVFPGRPAFQSRGSSDGVIEFDPATGRLSSTVEGEDVVQPYVESALFKLVDDDEKWSDAIDLTYRQATDALARFVNVEQAEPSNDSLDDDQSDDDADVRLTNRQSMEYRVSKASPEFRRLLDEVKHRIEAAGEGVMEVRTQNYTAYKTSSQRNFASVEIIPSKGVRILLKVDPTTLTLEPGFSRDVRNIGHWGPGDLEVSIRNSGDLDKAAPLIDLSFKNAAP